MLYLVSLFTDLLADIDTIKASKMYKIHVCEKLPFKVTLIRQDIKQTLKVENFGGGGGGELPYMGYGMWHFLRVLSWLGNKFLGPFCSL